jgi:hypothetical protein
MYGVVSHQNSMDFLGEILSDFDEFLKQKQNKLPQKDTYENWWRWHYNLQ